MLVSSIKGNGVQGNFDVVVRMRPQLDPEHLGDGLYFCAFDTGTMQWTAARPIMVDGRTIDGVTGDPAFMQSTFGTAGNYELLVPMGSELRHYWRDNDDPRFAWHAGHIYSFHATTEQGGGDAASVVSDVLGVSMLQSSMRSDGMHGDFAAIVQLSPRLDPAGLGPRLSFCSLDTGRMQWWNVLPIAVGGVVIGKVVGL